MPFCLSSIAHQHVYIKSITNPLEYRKLSIFYREDTRKPEIIYHCAFKV